MARTTGLRAQIDATEAMLDRILIAIDAYCGDVSAYPLSLDLSRLAGVLRIHFSLSDRHLYSFMIASGQRETAEIANHFQREIGHLGRRFDRFMERWSTSNAIASDVVQFRCEAEVMFIAIRSRMQREVRELLPLADALAEGNDAGFQAKPRTDEKMTIYPTVKRRSIGAIESIMDRRRGGWTIAEVPSS